MEKNFISLPMYQNTISKVAERRLWNMVFDFSLYTFGAHCVFLAITGILLSQFPFSKTVLTYSCFSFLIWLIPVVVYIWLKSRVKNHYSKIAKLLDRLNPHMDDGFQISQSLLSEGLEDSVRHQIVRYYKSKFTKLELPAGRSHKHAWAGALLGVFLWVLPTVFINDTRLYLANTIWPFQQLQKIPKLVFDIEPPPTTVKKEEKLKFKGIVRNYSEDQMIYAYITTDNKELRYPVDIKDRNFEFIYSSSLDFEIFFAADNGKSKNYTIRTLDEPRLSKMQLIVNPPAYTLLPADTLPVGMGEPYVYPGSNIKWLVSAGRPLEKLQFFGQQTDVDSQSLTLSLEEGTHYEFEFLSGGRKKKGDFYLPFKYWFSLEDLNGIETVTQPKLVLNLKEDRFPELEIVEPAVHLIENVNNLPLGFSAQDDFGISSLYLYYKVSSDGFVKDSSRVPILKWLKSVQGSYVFKNWDITKLGIRPENELELFLLGCDNDTVSGPKCKSSEKRMFRSPSIQEAMAMAAKQESEAVSLIKSAAERQKNVEQKKRRQEQLTQRDDLPTAQFEIRQILLENPRRLLSQAEDAVRRFKNMELRTGANSKINKTELRRMENDIQNSKRNLPSADVLQKDPKEQIKQVERLLKDQEKLKKRLSKINPQKNPEVASTKKFLEEKIDKAMEQENDLKEYLKSQESQKKLEERLKEEMLSEQNEAVQDVMEGTEELQKMIENSLKNPMFSKELLEKMEKVQELLREALPDSLRKLMEKKMEGQEVNASDLKNSLSKLMDNKEAFEQNIERALKALEDMKTLRELDEVRQELLQALNKQTDLKKNLSESGKSGKELATRQENINKSVNESLESLNNNLKNKKTPPSLSGEKQKGLQKKMENLKRQLQDLKQGNQAASNTAEDVIKQLSQMSEELSAMMAGMTGSSGPSLDVSLIERLTNESLKLSELQKLIGTDVPFRRKKGWESEEQYLYYSAFQIAKWIHQELQQLASQTPFVSSYLLTQSRLLSENLKHSSINKNHSSVENGKEANQKVTRELLKLLKLAKSMQNASGQGQGQGQGNPQNSSGEDPNASGGLSEQLKGLSGKQMAVNQATGELLKSLMRGAQTKGGEGSPQSLANSQGELGEKLESLAEGANEEGGAATKLRKLAEEARYIEQKLRKDRLSPNLKEHQERFRSRLLEAANALEERGFSDEREGKLSKNKFEDSPAETKIYRDKWQELLLKEKKKAQKTAISGREKEKVDGFFELMLTR